MQLPIAPQTYLPSSPLLIRTVKQARLTLGRVCCQETVLASAIALTRPDRPQAAEGNLAMEINLPAGGDGQQILDEIQAHFQALGCPCRQLLCTESTWPGDLASVLEQAGYQPVLHHIYLLRQYIRPAKTNTSLQIIPSRASYDQLRSFCLQVATEVKPHDNDQQKRDSASMAVDMLDEPGIESFLGRLDQKPVGQVNIFSQGQTGIIDSLYTLNSATGQGIASTLLEHAVDYCHRALFTQVLVQLPDGCRATGLYQKMGFVLAASFTQYQL